jgi:membrane-associated protease RseP (regulator of RpoE activity)
VSSSDPTRREIARSVLFFVLTFASVWGTYAFGEAGGPGIDTHQAVVDGLIFASGLLAVLLAHELGHYFVARHHGFSLSLPVFLPIPLAGFGTLGAVIRLRSPPRSRQALLEMGAAGPLAGAVVAFTLLAVFLPDFRPSPPIDPSLAYVYYNDPLIAKLLGLLLTGHVPPLDAVYHPAAFAGWAGCLLTGINLVPIGQLDGGHVLGAAFPGRARRLSRLLIVVAFAGVFVFVGWAMWGVILLALGAFRPLDVPGETRLPLRARIIGGLILALFLLTFIPAPVVGMDLFSVLGGLRAGG